MTNMIIGKCFICKKEITTHDASHIEEGQKHPAVRYYAKWPGDGFLCTEHPGVVGQYQRELEAADGNINKASGE